MTLTRIRNLSVEETSEDGELLFIESDSENQSENNVKPRETDASSQVWKKDFSRIQQYKNL